MTATLNAPVSVPSIVLMTRDEARACVNRIKANLEDVRAVLFDLKEREGWKALGYDTWQDCIRVEFAMSRQHAHRLINAHMVDRIMAGSDDGEMSPRGDIDQVPERIAREVAPVIDQPAIVREIVTGAKQARDLPVAVATARQAVDEHLARPPRQSKPKPERRSVSSKAESGDFGDDAPDYADLSQDLGDPDTGIGAADVNNEARLAGPAPLWCSHCDGDDHRVDACPHKEDPSLDVDAHAEDETVGAAAGPAASIPEDALGSEDAALAGDQGEASGADDDLSDEYPNLTAALAKERAQTHPSQERDRPLGDGRTADKNGSGGKGTTTVSAARVFSAPMLDAGDLTRMLLDFSPEQVAEAIAENATQAQRAALRQALGSPGQATAPVPEPTPEPAAPLDGLTVLQIADTLRAAVTPDALVSLLAVLADGVPSERLGPLAHRLTVKLRPSDPQEQLRAVKSAADDLSSGMQRALASHLFDRMTDDDKALFRTRVETAMADPRELAAGRMGR